MKDVMIDFETLGNGKNAAVCQIGAVYFDRKTGELGSEFKKNVCAESAEKSGAALDASTVYWWMSQDQAAIKSIMAEPREDIVTVFNELNDFLKNVEQVWSHATFDFVILMESMKRLGIKPKFSYRSARDIRTLIDLAGVNPRDSKFTRVGTHHDALDDAKFQVQYVVHAIQKLAYVEGL